MTIESLFVWMVVFVIIWQGMNILQFFMLLYYKLQYIEYTLGNPDEIDQDVKIIIKPYEEFLVQHGFIYQTLHTHYGPIKGATLLTYKLYYYNPTNGVHAFIETHPYQGALESVKISYTTIYESKRTALSVNEFAYAYFSIPKDTYLFDYYFGNYQEVYQSHLKDREIDREQILNDSFDREGVQAFYEYEDHKFIQSYIENGYIKANKNGLSVIPSFKLFTFSREFTKHHQQFSKTLLASQHDNPSNYETHEAQANSIVSQVDQMHKPRGETNKWNFFLISMVAFVFLYGLFGLSLIDIAMVVVILLVHELGHYGTMRYYGYVDTSIFFLPFGAAAVGKKSQKSASQEYIISMAGPIPGIIMGVAILVFNYQQGSDSYLNTYAFLSIVINYINLLPIYPLDGGRVIQTLLLNRYPKAQFWFYLVSLIILSFAMIWFQDFFMGISKNPKPKLKRKFDKIFLNYSQNLKRGKRYARLV